MATIEELQAQLAALTARVDVITTPPETYYTMLYQGETIDAILTDLLPARAGGSGLPVNQGGTGANTPQLALANLGGRPNKNLITNHYMIGTGETNSFPINQRGKKVYTPDWLQYSFDMWSVEANQEIRIEIKDGFVTLTNTSPDRTLQFKQMLPEELLVTGESYTLSTYVKNVSGGVIFQLGMTAEPYYGVCIMTPQSNEIVSATVDSLPAVSSEGWKVMYILPAGSSVTLADQKLEAGKVQTLGWKNSSGSVHLFETQDYAQELARCQRQLLKLGPNGATGYAENPTTAYLFVPLPVTMRAKPVWSGTLTRLYPYDGNSVSSVSVLSIADNMACLMVSGTGFIGGKVYSANELDGFLSAEP